MGTVKIVALGDSNTFSGLWTTPFVNLLTAEYPSTTYTLVNKGVAGRSTQDVYDNLADDLAGQNPNLVVIMVGTNDGNGVEYGYIDYVGTAPDLTYNSTTNIDDYDEVIWPDIISYIEAIDNGTPQNGGVPLIVVITPPLAANHPTELGVNSQIGEQAADQTVPSYVYCRPRRNLAIYQSKCEALATANNLPFADTYTEMLNTANWLSTLLSEGLHFSNAGGSLVADVVYDAVVPYLDAEGLVNGAPTTTTTSAPTTTTVAPTTTTTTTAAPHAQFDLYHTDGTEAAVYKIDVI